MRFKNRTFNETPLEERKQKECGVCKTLFFPRSGVNKFCSTSCKGKWKYIIGKETTASQYLKISGNWNKYFLRLVTGHSRKADGLTVSDCLELLEQQENKCALSGITLTCVLEVGNISKTNASLDRIQAGGPYIKENLQLVCRALNSWRGATDLREFIWWCKKVTEFQEGKE